MKSYQLFLTMRRTVLKDCLAFSVIISALIIVALKINTDQVSAATVDKQDRATACPIFRFWKDQWNETDIVSQVRPSTKNNVERHLTSIAEKIRTSASAFWSSTAYKNYEQQPLFKGTETPSGKPNDYTKRYIFGDPDDYERDRAYFDSYRLRTKNKVPKISYAKLFKGYIKRYIKPICIYQYFPKYESVVSFMNDAPDIVRENVVSFMNNSPDIVTENVTYYTGCFVHAIDSSGIPDILPNLTNAILEYLQYFLVYLWNWFYAYIEGYIPSMDGSLQFLYKAQNTVCNMVVGICKATADFINVHIYTFKVEEKELSYVEWINSYYTMYTTPKKTTYTDRALDIMNSWVGLFDLGCRAPAEKPKSYIDIAYSWIGFTVEEPQNVNNGFLCSLGHSDFLIMLYILLFLLKFAYLCYYLRTIDWD